GRVLPARGTGRGGSPDPVRLQHPWHRSAQLTAGGPGREQIPAVHAAARPVRQHEQKGWLARLVQFDAGRPAAGFYLHAGQPSAVAWAGSRAGRDPRVATFSLQDTGLAQWDQPGGLYVQELLEELAGVALLDPGDLLRGARRHHGTAAGPALGAEVDDPVRGLDHVEVVLDHD